MSSSARYEDLKEELSSVRDKTRARLRQGISEGILNNILTEGDGILALMRKEVDAAPSLVSQEMRSNWSTMETDWQSFKGTCKTNPGSMMGGGSMAVTDPGLGYQGNMALVRGTAILERTSDSVWRASQVARESEQIGTAVIEELGEQRDSLLRTQVRLDEAGHELKRTHYMIRAINRRVLTNKCILVIIILMEALILAGVSYYKFFKK